MSIEGEMVEGLTESQKREYLKNRNPQRDIALTGGYDLSGMPARGYQPEQGIYLLRSQIPQKQKEK
ncbi:MAG: hypothetical protein KGQ58_06050 [Proteobacteria bacterium]|nr:hypothetical protein [Pseudomonadota bacterium]